jgi:tetratricopeptide (TPR) repeat protein
MKKLFVLFCLIAPLTALAQETLEEIKEKALAHSNEGLHKEALQYYLKVLKLEPTGLYYGHVGYELMTLDRDDEAKPFLEKATAMTPLEPVFWIDLALIYSNKKQYAEALPILEKGIASNPDSPGLLAAKAKCLFRLNRSEEALPLLNETLKTNYFEADLIFTRAQILEKKGDLAAAYADYTRGLGAYPDHYGMLAGIAAVLRKQEKYEEEIIIRKRTLQLFLDKKETKFLGGTHALLGLAYSNIEDHANALREFDASIALEPKFAEVFIQRCITKILLKDLEGACADLSEAMRLKPEEASDMRDFFEENIDFSEFLASCSPEL